jgi:hypothetical protein
VDVTALAVVEDRVYWVREVDNALWSAPLAGGRSRRIQLQGVVHAVAADGALFAIAEAGVYRIGSGEPELIYENTDLHNLAIDGGYLYAAHQRDIMRVPLGGGEGVLYAQLEHEIGEMVVHDGTLATVGHLRGDDKISILAPGAAAWLHIATPPSPHSLQWTPHGYYLAAARTVFQVRADPARVVEKLGPLPEDDTVVTPVIADGAAIYVADGDGDGDGRFAIRRICHAP